MSFTLPREDVTAGLLALAVHGFFVLLLVLGVSWQIHNPQPVMADLWQSLPELPRPEPLLPPEPPAEPVPPPKPAPLPEPKQKVAEELKNKRAEEKKRRDEARRMEVELEREAAQMEADSLKKEQDKKLAEIKLRESLKREEEEMQQRMLEESLAAEAGQLKAKAAADQRASEIEKIVARYKEMISAKIRGNTRLPENLPGNPEVDFNVSVLPTGEIAKISLTKGSGNAAYDEAVRRGIEKSSPLPLPPDKAAAAKFRDLDLKHKARE
jgi:colicin import membrane protein